MAEDVSSSFRQAPEATPLVSVLIPCYNSAKTLVAAVESALNQTWPKVEVVLVNDGSRDDSLAVAQGIQDPRLQVIDQANGGASSARNQAFRASRGDWIQYLDADDILAPDKIERQLSHHALANQSILRGDWIRFTDEVPSEAPPDFESQVLPETPSDFLTAMWAGYSMVQPGAWLCPRNLIERAGGWDETLSLDDDGAFFARVIASAEAVIPTPGAIAWYRSAVSGSLSGRKSAAAWKSQFQANEQKIAALRSARDDAETRAAGAVLHQRFIYAAYPQVPKLIKQAQARIEALGGCDEAPTGGPRFQRLRRLFGWKLAKRAQVLLGI